MIPDAVLRYTHAAEDGRRRMLSFFIEVDRATMQTTRLAAKLSAYARYQSYVPRPVAAAGVPPARPGATTTRPSPACSSC